MTWSSFKKWKKNTYVACMQCLSTSESIIWSLSQSSVSSSRMKSTTWLIISPKKAYDPVKRTWKLWPNLLHHKHTLKSEPFGLVGYYQWFIKGFTCIAQPLHTHLSGEGASKKGKCVMLTEEVLGTFEMLKGACLEAPVLSLLISISHSS